MAYFKGKNTTKSSINNFFYRGLYRNEAFTSVFYQPGIRDFSYTEYVLYGRVDTILNTVYPDESLMKPIISEENTETTHRALGFVVDAFQSVKNAMESAKVNSIIPSDDPIFSRFNIKKSYQSPINLYNEYIDNLMNRFVFDHLVGKNLKKEVIKFEHFVNHFISFLKSTLNHIPFTFTSFQRSTTSNIFTSGVALDIGGLEFGVDADIEEMVLNSPCFPYYTKVCLANGFLISQLSPTLMVADILSPALLPYAQQNDVFNTIDLFATQYNYAYRVDYDFLQNKLIDGYNLLAATFPFEKISNYKCSRKISSTIKDRTPVTPFDVQHNIPMSYWLLTYAKIRNIEEQYNLDKDIMKMLLNKLKTTKYLDKTKAMWYINTTFQRTYKTKYGGINYIIHKEQQKRKNEPSIEAVKIMPPSESGGGSSGGSSGGY